MKIWKGPLNRLLIMNRQAHRIMQNIGGNRLGITAAGGGRCFYVVSAEIGLVDPEQIRVCFNKPYTPELPGECLTTDPAVWDFGTAARGLYDNDTLSNNPTPLCIDFAASYLDSGGETPRGNQTGPGDNVWMDYNPGSCHAEGDAECLLPAYSQYPVTNNIYGPSSARVGDLADNIVVIEFPTPPGVIGDNWDVSINAGPFETVSNSQIVGNSIQLTIGTSVQAGDTVTLGHNGSANKCVAADGRVCWQFENMPVLNVVGVSFWHREDAGPWKLDSNTGDWILG